MSVLSNIYNAVVRRAKRFVFQLGTQEVYAEITAEKAITKGFNSNTAVYSIVMKDAEKFASIPRYVYDKAKYEEKAGKPKYGRKALKEKPYLTNDLSRLLDRPNENQSADEFFSTVRAFYKTAGEAFIWLNRGDTMTVDSFGSLQELSDKEQIRKPVLEMFVIPPDKIIIIPDKEDVYGVDHYLFDFGERVPIRRTDIIHWKSTTLKFDPVTRTHMRGFPPLEAGYKTLQQNNDATNSAVRMYQNDGSKGFIFNESFTKLSAQQESDVRNVIDRKINSNDVKGAVATLQGKWGYVNLGGTSVDMELIKGKEMSWKELCFLLKVPYEFFDSETTFANKEQALIGWITNDIYPALKRLDGELNRMLLPAFGLENKAFIGCDISELPEIRKVMVESAKAMMEIWAITPNEIREYLGYESSDDPTFDEQWVPTTRQPLSMTGDNQANQIMNDLETQRLQNEIAMGNSNGKVSQNGRGT